MKTLTALILLGFVVGCGEGDNEVICLADITDNSEVDNSVREQALEEGFEVSRVAESITVCGVTSEIDAVVSTQDPPELAEFLGRGEIL